MPSTTTHGLPYPVATDAPNIPSDMQNLASTVDTKLLTGGKSIVATTETFTSTTYTLATTPDRVQSIVVPADAIVQIRFMALWQRSLSAADARAAIFVGSNQLQKATDASVGAGVQEAQMSTASTHAIDQILGSGPGGLFSTDSVAGGSPTSFPTTGILLGGGNKAVNESSGTQPQYGAAEIHGLSSGTYDFSVQYKSSSGSVTVKSRRLWVRVLAF